MSVLATITVVKCDRCEKIETFRSEDQYLQYERQWHTDPIFDYCPDCRLSNFEKQIQQDAELIDALIAEENDKFLMENF